MRAAVLATSLAETTLLAACGAAQCMRRHGFPKFPGDWGGIHVGQFTALGIDVHSPQFQAAMKTCGWH